MATGIGTFVWIVTTGLRYVVAAPEALTCCLALTDNTTVPTDTRLAEAWTFALAMRTRTAGTRLLEIRERLLSGMKVASRWLCQPGFCVLGQAETLVVACRRALS
jgi:hypothetical protein